MIEELGAEILEAAADVALRNKGWASLMVSALLVGGVVVWWTW